MLFLFPFASSKTLRAQTTKRPILPRLETCRTVSIANLNPANVGKKQWMAKRTQRSEEPTVLAAGVAVLKGLLDVLLGVLAGGNLLEGLGGDGTLKTLELKGVASGHQVVVVDDLDEGLDAAALLDGLLTHAAGDLEGVALDTGDDGVREGVRLGASVVRLDNDDLSFAKRNPRQHIYPCTFRSLLPPW